MKKSITIVSIVLISFGILSLMYSSMKLAEGAQINKQNKERTDPTTGFKFKVRDESERRGESSMQAGLILLGAGVLLFAGSRVVKQNKNT